MEDIADNKLQWDKSITEQQLLSCTLNGESIWIAETLNKMEKYRRRQMTKLNKLTVSITRRYCKGMLFEEITENAERWTKACENLRRIYSENQFAELMNVAHG